jgi:hypothetical protein
VSHSRVERIMRWMRERADQAQRAYAEDPDLGFPITEVYQTGDHDSFVIEVDGKRFWITIKEVS